MEDEDKKGLRPSKNKFQMDPLIVAKYSKGEGPDLKKNTTKIKNKFVRQKMERKEKIFVDMAEKAARKDRMFLIEDPGYLEKDPGETTTQFRQSQIAASLDKDTASKFFEVNSEFGPYCMKYSRNGRHLLLGGKRGHVTSFDWMDQKVACEFNAMESIHAVTWLHSANWFAVAQKEWVYVYDNQGIEMHCLKRMNRAIHLEFLPYYYLLASAAETGCLTWMDITIGEIVSRVDHRRGKITSMTQNPQTAMLYVGESRGVVSMWTPNERNPQVKLMCHRLPITSCTVHPNGVYMATCCPDRSVKVFDVRNFRDGNVPVHSLKLPTAAQYLSYSQRGMLAVGMGNIVEVFKETDGEMKRYMRHRTNWNISSLEFCPFEDVLGFGNTKGFTSIIIPGSGEPNFDALEVNPYQTKKQRQEAEVKSLLDKLQPEFIQLNPDAVTEVDVPTLQEQVEAKKKLLFIKPKDLEYLPRKANVRGKGVKIVKAKKALRYKAKRDAMQAMRDAQVLIDKPQRKPEKKKSFGAALDRFLPKSKQKDTAKKTQS